MAVLPDLATASLYAVVVFLLVLGVLVVFVETVSFRKLVIVVLGAVLTASILLGIGEAGMAIVAMGVAAAVLANQTFEWLTNR
jgi:uncharacterized membrane protein (DUF485 family)